ncbi:hypothetical protein HGRIS_011321 [Hohenbuehelia grisea]|uniref:Carbonic anhydrase n=1 Tax=Hohenbuehelia grisea TaxID=104357 RepID=A0ABR3JWG8_9AGAR
MVAIRSFVLLAVLTTGLAHPLTEAKRRTAPELEALLRGNQKFRSRIAVSGKPDFLHDLAAHGQHPPFMFLGCSDSRVDEDSIFSTSLGTMFTERNIANQFHHEDANTHSVLSYAVAKLGVKHILVTGHYGCGGVAAAIETPPKPPLSGADEAIQKWIAPIREIFQTSTRKEIVELRERNKGHDEVHEPKADDPGFRALVEENVKASVQEIVNDGIIGDYFKLLEKEGHNNRTAIHGDIFVHGLVYDIDNGEVRDLKVSVGPPGKEVLTTPFPPVGTKTQAIQAPKRGSRSSKKKSSAHSRKAEH